VGEITETVGGLNRNARALSPKYAGALLKRKPGRYAINPHGGWVGDPATRQKAAKHVPSMRLVDPVV